MSEMMTEQLDEWRAFYTLEPWGYRIDNNRFAVTTATIANALVGASALKPSDIFPDQIKSKAKDVSSEASAALGQMLKSLNG